MYLKFGRGIAKISKKSLTVLKDFVILKFGHEHSIHFYFSDRPLSQSFFWILLWKLQSVPKLLGHWFWWLWQGTNKGKYFRVWLGLPITNCKAQNHCENTNTPLVLIDTCPTRSQDQHDCEQLLNLNMTSSRLQHVLPSFLPLYVGMPVILKTKNISTELGIMNSSQGFVCTLHTDVLSAGLTYCTCVLVKFLHSKVHIPGLMKGYFLIVPIRVPCPPFSQWQMAPKLMLLSTKVRCLSKEGTLSCRLVQYWTPE